MASPNASPSRRTTLRRQTTDLSLSSTSTLSVSALNTFHRRTTLLEEPADDGNKRIDVEQNSRCREFLSEIKRGALPGEINQVFSKSVMFKNRPLTCCQVLHFAVIDSAQEQTRDDVSKVLAARADVNAKAMYATVKKDALRQEVTYETELEAIHIAAGLGHIPALEELLAANGDGTGLVSRFATVNISGAPERFDFYMPIHDAAYLGQKDAVLWLLRQRARADAGNKDGCTPLHFIALVGGRGSLMDGEVQEVVAALLDFRANLGARSYSAREPYPCDPFLQEKIPLEIAAETQYPKDLLYLMAASYQSTDLDTPRAFADILLLSQCNMKVAENFTRDLVVRAKEDQGLFDMIVKEAQMSGAVDRVAALLYMVPFAGADILDMLCVPPNVQDAARHPLPPRTTLHTGPVRCAYQPDHVKRRQLTWPQWQYNAESAVQKTWHNQFIPRKAGGVRLDNVYDVDVKVTLLPNMLDVDIFMALTRTWETHDHVFAKLPIQGAIYCLWDRLVWPVFAFSWLFLGIELGVLLLWGVQPSSKDQTTNSLQNVSRYWAILLGGAVREGLNLFWWFLAHWSKWHSHDDPTMKSLWHLNVFFTDPWFLSSSFTLACRLLLVVPCCYDSFFHHRDPVMTEWEQGLLAINTFAQGFAVTYMLRLLHRFKRILAIFKTFFSRTILEMMLIAAMIFASFSFAFLTLIRQEEAGWTVTYLYRGLMFGDGDGLDKMGLMLGESETRSNKFALVLFMVGGTILFNVTILNLVIAIYGNEYERVNAETELHFIKERAKYCLIYVEMLHKQRLLHIVAEITEIGSEAEDHHVTIFTKLVVTVTQSLLALLELQQQAMKRLGFIRRLSYERRWDVLLPLIVGSIIAAPHVLDLLCFILDMLPITSAFAISSMQIAIQAMLIQADWFQPDAPELAPGVEVAKASGKDAGTIMRQESCEDGPKWRVKLHQPAAESSYLARDCELEIQNSKFLWLCYRSDYSEQFFFGAEEISRHDLEQVQRQLEETNARLDNLESNIGQKLDVLLKLSMGDDFGLSRDEGSVARLGSLAEH